ncbi:MULTISPECIES: alpha-ketoacid dehydrogenase subunit beta [Aerococcus]|uniref:Alpha-ketoacid dehydrogenase subunit beta n=1 Tax=Aerococcus sanguinicola TaxID=119206 RepID=A0A5N1GJW7_9LACT|nr:MULTISPECIES: alpha-ketoacid dehydrogenase subunit beta [Aerococcus]KAA9301273.1 alpha-ketoacid dehydrogenase subunit beta [Aerococcus sanguinicola]MDK6369190.1 alpha-ketoacid dehydrogenase subunit beta [Aerococcus sp. UMB9870]MDK6679014.1 alpha-ketoacid dehydrogenase subunit beta [Aerococcus sp. UMB8608]MDK6687437.1 alpha-ketoacid dehydrogenase subunit beta [Aerococcus sp. UMB8623]MDK6940076.1 alpha-ketoacid dehydrogenase subunit beta [Aerococcus sp. UMB8487]
MYNRKNPEAGNNLTMVKAINQALELEMAQDDRVILFGQDVGKNGGVFRATEGLQEKFGKQRVLDTPLAESGISGMAIGLAYQGFRPVIEIQFLGFIFETMDSINQMARASYRTAGHLKMPVVLRAPFGGGVGTPEFHPDNFEGLLAQFPGLKVVIPSSAIDAKGLLTAAIRDDGPVIFLEHMLLYRSFREKVPEESYSLALDQANCLCEGEDLTLVTYGAMVRMAKEAVERAAAEGIRVELIDLRSVHPIDYDTILQSVKKTQHLLVVQEAQGIAGVGNRIVSEMARRAFYDLLSPIGFLSAPNTSFPYKQIESDWLPDCDDIVEAIKTTLNG